MLMKKKLTSFYNKVKKKTNIWNKFQTIIKNELRNALKEEEEDQENIIKINFHSGMEFHQNKSKSK